jgi:hypothetical protein
MGVTERGGGGVVWGKEQPALATPVLCQLAQPQRCGLQGGPQVRGDEWGGGLLQDLLVSALQMGEERKGRGGGAWASVLHMPLELLL